MICECGDHAWAPISKGHVVLVSPEDAYLLEKKWHATISRGSTVYARRNIPRRPEDTVGRRQERLHALIVKPRKGCVVDHINLNGLDNRRPNLRECTDDQNRNNRRLRPDNALGVKGVKYTGSGKFMARITLNRKLRYLGTFDTSEAAHQAYARAAQDLHGEFGRAS